MSIQLQQGMFVRQTLSNIGGYASPTEIIRTDTQNQPFNQINPRISQDVMSQNQNHTPKPPTNIPPCINKQNQHHQYNREMPHHELDTPQNHPEFDDQLMQSSQTRYNITKKVKKLERERQIGVIKEEIKKAILKLKNDKTAHEYEIRANHIKRTGDESLVANKICLK
ncbi:unnamed protein product [Mytilus coruscus]|uniref:Uncharacterized protein n=1 Tax=Mytilus coruscus TaxID=42192 RepID=A0A6J8BUI2_MYTCO|nr:unnamed protein product [Mytilus coruscus]